MPLDQVLAKVLWLKRGARCLSKSLVSGEGGMLKLRLSCSKILQSSLVSKSSLKIVILGVLLRLSLVVCVGQMNPEVLGSNHSKTQI